MRISDRGHIGMAKSWAMKPKFDFPRSYREKAPSPQHPEGSMTVSETPSSVAERRLAIARRLYEAPITQDRNKAITLCDSSGGVVARHDPPSEQSDPLSERRSEITPC
jgi:hypothetical protein